MIRHTAINGSGATSMAIVGVLGMTLAGCDPSEPPAPPPPPPSAEAEAESHVVEVQHLQVVALDDIKTIIAETAARDQVLVIDFWATWCAPCVEMFPAIHEGLVARGDGVRAVSVTLDDPSREAAAMAFLGKHDALHDAYIIKNDSAAQQALADGMGGKWNSLAVPAILVYDSDGKLVGEFLEGGTTDAILDQVDSLLASGQEP